ncbi:MAG: hypothetical protein K8L99_00350 [Anaerolineae bacterium]|nr:hypothetical protein [Anaerolineae bacterium]
MPVLLLARGDTQAKDLLRRSIEARYGVVPPAIENLEIDFKGRARAKVGPITTWVPVEITAHFRFPNAARWDFAVNPAGLTLQRGIEAFDGNTYRYMRSSSTALISENADLIYSLQQRLWAMAAVLLTPLGEHFVSLKYLSETNLEATNTLLNTTVNLRLRPDSSLEEACVQCLNPDNNRQQQFTMHLSQTQQPVDDIMMPTKISSFWDKDAYFEAEPTHVTNSTMIADEVFTLAGH